MKTPALCQGLLFCWVLTACSDEGSCVDCPVPRANVIAFSPLYTAFGGERSYSITPYVPAALSKDDPLVTASFRWRVDDKFLAREDFADAPSGASALKLTTRRAGKTSVKLSATSVTGVKQETETRVEIAEADDALWTKGDERYNRGELLVITIADFGPPTDEPFVCGIAPNSQPHVPEDAGCKSCHVERGGLAPELTPMQTAGYSDAELIDLFTRAVKPAGFSYSSPWMRMMPDPDCMYPMLHTWPMDAETARGVVLKLRSLEPQPRQDADRAKLKQFQARAQAAGAAGAAP